MANREQARVQRLKEEREERDRKQKSIQESADKEEVDGDKKQPVFTFNLNLFKAQKNQDSSILKPVDTQAKVNNDILFDDIADSKEQENKRTQKDKTKFKSNIDMVRIYILTFTVIDYG